MAPPNQNDPYAALPDVPDQDPYVNLPDAGTTSAAAPFVPTHTVQATPPFWSVAGMKEHGYRLARGVLDALPTIGGVAGGIVGAGAGVESGPGAFVTGAAGAAAGGGLGEDLKQAGEHALFNDGPTTVKDSLKDMGKAAAIQGVNDATGRLGGKMLAPAFKYFNDTATASAKAGIPLMPSEAAGTAPSFAEKFLKGSVLTSGQMQRFRVMQNAQTQAAAAKVADGISNFSGTSEQLGQLVQQGIEAHTQQFRAVQNAMYSDIDNAVAEKTVLTPVQKNVGAGFMQQTVTQMVPHLEGPAMPSMAPLKEFAAKELKLLDQQEKVLDPNLLSPSRQMLQQMMDSPDRVTFKAMASSRSDLLAMTRKLDEALPGKQAGFAKKLASLADQSMMDAAEKSGIPDLPEKIRAANALTANEHQMFEQALVKKVVETKKPEAIAGYIQAKGVGLPETRDLFTVLPKDLHPAVQAQILQDAMTKSTDMLSKTFDERKFAQTVESLGDQRGQIVFGSNWSNIKQLSSLMQRINGPVGLMGGGSGAALQNAGLFKNAAVSVAALLATPMSLAGTGHTAGAAYAAASEAGLLALRAGVYKATAMALTNPDTTARLIKAAQQMVKYAPNAATGAYELSQGQTKASRDLAAIRAKYAKPATPPVQ